MSASVDMTMFITPKSDQLNADDLIGGPRTITVTKVSANQGSAEQPVSISFEGDNGKPYKPCKSMRRVLVHVWGSDARNYIGRSITLYCDPSVQFGGIKVGGIRISHMSHIDKEQTMALTATRGKRAPFTVYPLKAEPSAPTIVDYERCPTRDAFEALEQRRQTAWKQLKRDEQSALKSASEAAKARLSQPAERTPYTEANAIEALDACKSDQARADLMKAIVDDFDARSEDLPLTVDDANQRAKDRIAEPF